MLWLGLGLCRDWNHKRHKRHRDLGSVFFNHGWTRMGTDAKALDGLTTKSAKELLIGCFNRE